MRIAERNRAQKSIRILAAWRFWGYPSAGKGPVDKWLFVQLRCAGRLRHPPVQLVFHTEFCLSPPQSLAYCVSAENNRPLSVLECELCNGQSLAMFQSSLSSKGSIWVCRGLMCGGLYMRAGGTQIISTCILATHFKGFLIINGQDTACVCLP